MAKISISGLLKEARRRRVFRVAAIYIVGAWILLQVADNAFPAFGIPEAAIRYVYLGVVLAFPLAIIFGWRYDIVDGRLIRTLTTDESADLSLTRFDIIILTTLAFVVAAIAIGLGREITVIQSSVNDYATANDVDPASIAVMPFVNMSPDPDISFFADGVSEELLNGLAKVAGLRVAGRTSSFSLRNENLDIRQIGRRLNVAYVLEGSLRVDGEKLRVTAQLVDSRDDSHMWSETYDRAMTDILAVQEEIANKVVTAMQSALPSDILPPPQVSTTSNPEAYGHYLRALSLYRNSFETVTWGEWEEGEDAYMGMLADINSAIAVDPNYVDAYVVKANIHVGLARHYEALGDLGESRAEKIETAISLARKALSTATVLAPESASALFAQGVLADDIAQAEQAYRAAVALNPSSAEVHLALSSVLLQTSDLEEGVDFARKAHLLDPLNPVTFQWLAKALNLVGELKESSDYVRLGALLSRPTQDGPSKSDKERFRSESVDLPYLSSDMHLNLTLAPTYENSFEMLISNDADTGDKSVHLAALHESGAWASISTRARAHPYRGKYLRLIGMIKTKGVPKAPVQSWHAQSSPAGGAMLWLRADGWIDDVGPRPFSFMNGQLELVSGTTPIWERRELRIYVPHDADRLIIGAVLLGSGEMWVNEFQFEVSDNPDFD